MHIYDGSLNCHSSKSPSKYLGIPMTNMAFSLNQRNCPLQYTVGECRGSWLLKMQKWNYQSIVKQVTYMAPFKAQGILWKKEWKSLKIECRARKQSQDSAPLLQSPVHITVVSCTGSTQDGPHQQRARTRAWEHWTLACISLLLIVDRSWKGQSWSSVVTSLHRMAPNP